MFNSLVRRDDTKEMTNERLRVLASWPLDADAPQQSPHLWPRLFKWLFALLIAAASAAGHMGARVAEHGAPIAKKVGHFAEDVSEQAPPMALRAIRAGSVTQQSGHSSCANATSSPYGC